GDGARPHVRARSGVDVPHHTGQAERTFSPPEPGRGGRLGYVAFDGQVLTFVIVLAVVAVLALVLRWTFGRGSADRAPGWPPMPDAGTRAAANEDYGLLAAAATVDSQAEDRKST